MRASSAIALGLVALVPAAASAQPAERARALVVLLDARGPLAGSDAAVHTLGRLRRAIDEIGAAAPDTAALAARRDARVDPALVTGAAGLRAQAEQAFRRLDAQAALRLLEQASILHRRRFADVLGDAEASLAARLAAAIYRSEGRALPMRDALRDAVQYAPDTPMDPGLYPPELVHAFEAERTYVLAAGLPLAPPTRLCEAGRLLGASAVVTVAPLATREDELGLDVYDPDTCSRRLLTVTLRDDPEAARRTASAILVPGSTVIAETLVSRPGPAPVQTLAPDEPTPWYGRWYTIAGASALIVGGVILGLVLGPSNDGVQVTTGEVHPPE